MPALQSLGRVPVLKASNGRTADAVAFRAYSTGGTGTVIGLVYGLRRNYREAGTKGPPSEVASI